MSWGRRFTFLFLLALSGCQAPPPAPSITSPAAVLIQPEPAALPYSGRINGSISDDSAAVRPSAAYGGPAAISPADARLRSEIPPANGD